MMRALVGERRVAKRWLCLDERARRRLPKSKQVVEQGVCKRVRKTQP